MSNLIILLKKIFTLGESLLKGIDLNMSSKNSGSPSKKFMHSNAKKLIGFSLNYWINLY